MKCFIKSLLGMNLQTEGNEICEPLPPIVKSVVGGVIFVSLMLMFLFATSS